MFQIYGASGGVAAAYDFYYVPILGPAHPFRSGATHHVQARSLTH